MFPITLGRFALRPLTITLLFLAITTSSMGIEFPNFEVSDHPFSRHPHFIDHEPRPNPSIVGWYNQREKSDHKKTIFFPRKASYNHIVRDKPQTVLARSVDALLVQPLKVPGEPRDERDVEPSFDENDEQEDEEDDDDTVPDIERSVTVAVNNDTRVVLLLYGNRIFSSVAIREHSVQGLDEWKHLGGVKNADPPGTFQEPGCDSPPNLDGCLKSSESTICRNENVKFPEDAVALERTYSAGDLIVLPHPNLVSVLIERGESKNGMHRNPKKHSVESYVLLFGEPNDSNEPMVPFPEPAVPKSVLNPMKGTMGPVSKPIPNKSCPEWLHDTYAEPSLSSRPDTNTSMYWRTWHPLIDPIYWCYFTHEHGQYPGPGYRPLFHYTASKTLIREPNVYQDESHNGFKIFSFLGKDISNPSSGDKMFVVTIHMHLACSGRFSTTEHTVISAILSPPSGSKDWELLFEIQKKADFGFGFMSTYNKRGKLALTEEEEKKREIKEHPDNNLGISASRRINVYNDKNYPYCLDPRLFYNDGKKKALSYGEVLRLQKKAARGAYEIWRTPLDACSESSYMDGTRDDKRGLSFSATQPPTGMLTIPKWETFVDDHWKLNNETIAPGKVDFSLSATEQCSPYPSWGNFSVFTGNGLQRRFELKNAHKVSFDKKYCQTSNGIDLNVDSVIKDGVFYTDVRLESTFAGPGTQRIAQYISPNFSGITLEKPSKSFTKNLSSLQRGMRNLENAMFVEGN